MKRAIAGGSRLLILVLGLALPPRASSCPPACVCYREPMVTVSCQQQGLTAVPADIPAHSQRIFLHRNRISSVGAASFAACCRNATILWVHSNNLSRIEPGALAGLARLEELDISDNRQLRTLDPAAFRGLGRLRTLRADRCGLLELAPGLLRGLGSLRYLYLQDNALRRLPEDAFLDLAGLAYLFLHGNRLQSLPEHAFRGLRGLDRLLLHENRIAQVHRRAFRGLGRLLTLYLFNNSLSELAGEALAPLQSLQYLRLNANPWVCDCRARSLWAWLRRFGGSSSEVECRRPAHLAGRDLKSLAEAELDGCADPGGGGGGGDAGLGGGLDPLLKCCRPQPETEKSFLYEASGPAAPLGPRPGPSPRPAKEKENMAKPPPPRNATHKQINDSPFGTPPGRPEPPRTAPASAPAPPRRRPACSRRNRTKPHCRLPQPGNGSAARLGPGLRLLILPLGWSLLAGC
ncbi:reticulon-4 receptor [Ornithorhynchus anatinus]|uniref:reticulon-4 receptor n=1 Tax=Ornithorhynchus anatinus TaxID=9258 RepID=UPI0010A8FBB6|nr:reticulon-4 receptor [Ornithorhynchus anatinus]